MKRCRPSSNASRSRSTSATAPKARPSWSLPDTPYFRTYRVNYVNMSRDTTSSIGVSGEITGYASDGRRTGSQQSGRARSEQHRPAPKSTARLRTISGKSCARTSKPSSRPARPPESPISAPPACEAERAAKEERIAQAEAVSRAGANAAPLFENSLRSSSGDVHGYQE